MAAEIVVEVPDIGDFTDVPIIEVHVAVGSEVALDEPLLTLESDKATMDVPAETAGTVTEIRVAVGDTVSRGTPIMVVTPSDGGAAGPPTAPSLSPGRRLVGRLARAARVVCSVRLMLLRV